MLAVLTESRALERIELGLDILSENLQFSRVYAYNRRQRQFSLPCSAQCLILSTFLFSFLWAVGGRTSSQASDNKIEVR